MNEFLTSLLFIMAEFGIVISVFFVVLVVIFFMRRKKNSEISTQFKEDVKSSSTERMQNLENSLSSSFQLNGEDTKSYAEEIIKNERKIFSNVLKIFSGKDKSLILSLQDDLASLNQTYQKLANKISSQVDSSVNVSSSEDGDEALLGEVNVLREENARLKEDLKKSLESIDYLQVQYSDLFDKTQEK